MLARVPYADQWQISNRVVFVMVSACGGHYLSPELHKGRSTITFSESVYLTGSDDWAAEMLLPQIPLVVLQARHACEPPMEMRVGEWLDPKTGLVTNDRRFREAAKEYRNASVDLQIDAHFADKKAAELVEQWNDAWARAHPAPPVPAPESPPEPKPMVLSSGGGGFDTHSPRDTESTGLIRNRVSRVR